MTEQKNEVSKLINLSLIDLHKDLAPHISEIEAISQNVANTAKMEDVSEALEILGKMQGELDKLKMDKGVWGFRWLQNLIQRTQWSIKKRILARKGIRTAILELKSQWEVAIETLEKNVEKAEGIRDASVKCSGTLNNLIEKLQGNIDTINAALPTISDQDKGKASNAMRRFEKIKADTRGFLFLHETTAEQANQEVTQRETLFSSMTILGPQINILIDQQLSKLVSQKDVRNAVELVKRFKEGIAQIAILNAQMTREDAVSVAKIAYSPFIEAETINKVTEHYTRTIEEVKSAIVEGLKAGKATVTAAIENKKKITEANKQLTALMEV